MDLLAVFEISPLFVSDYVERTGAKTVVANVVRTTNVFIESLSAGRVA